MLARVRFLARAEEADRGASALFIPSAALRDGSAWVVEGFDGSQGIARARSLDTAGDERDGWIRVGEGLRPGDLVISPSPSGLREGERVAVSPARN